MMKAMFYERSELWLVITLIGLLLLSGCGKGDRLETAKVKGIVTLNGKVVERGVVSFSPQAGRGGRGLIRPDGTYELTTYVPNDGAILGKHRVSVTATTPRKSVDEEPEYIVPPRFGEPATSGLEYVVTPSGENRFDITLLDP
jgi:hypothetical protein